jgi:hypothetical protein
MRIATKKGEPCSEPEVGRANFLGHAGQLAEAVLFATGRVRAGPGHQAAMPKAWS